MSEHATPSGEGKSPTNLLELAMKRPLTAIAAGVTLAVMSGGSLSGLIDAVIPDQEAGTVKNAAERLIAAEEAIKSNRSACTAQVDALRLAAAYAIETRNTNYLLAGAPQTAFGSPSSVEVRAATQEAVRAENKAKEAAVRAEQVQQAAPVNPK